MGGARRNFLADGTISCSATSSKCHLTSNEDQPIPPKPDSYSSRCIVPGIGLHLNALARTSMDYTSNSRILATQLQSINDLSLDAASKNQEPITQSLTLTSPVDGGLCVGEDAYQLCEYFGFDDLNQGSLKKKRKMENEGCRRCNCKKSKCLKLYCECFAASVYCVEPCSCQGCFNKLIHDDVVLASRKQIESRNPLAFAPKVIRTTDFVSETADDLSTTPASARHKRGCNCKKSGCLKKYCECYQGGVGCSINCRCEGCKNMHGRKVGSHTVLAEAEVEDTNTHENRSLSKHTIQNNIDQTPESALQETPMPSSRAPLQRPFSTFYGRSKIGISEFSIPNNLENEIREILRSPTTGIKFYSPNGKRVSPPHCNFESSSSPVQITCRKLILQSIPSFPSLKD